MKKYHIKLKNGETRYITILDKCVFRCLESGDGTAHYLTRQQLIQSKSDKKLIDVDLSEPYHLYCSGLGFILDESAMFDIYKKLRNPIIKLEVL